MRHGFSKHFIALLSFFLTSTMPSTGAEISVINARLGAAKAPRFKAEHWAQLMVTIRNKGPQVDAEVQYTPLSLGFARSATLFRKQITVPAQSEIEIFFPVLVAMDENFLIELFVDGVATDKQQFSSSMVSISDPFVLILDDGITGYSYFKDLRIEGRKATLSIAQSRDVPTWWEIIDSLTLMVVGDIDLHKFQQPQIEALQAWIEAGGILVVSTDERWRRLRGSFLEEWLPVRMYGARPIDSMEPLGERYGKPLAMDEDLMLCEAYLADGRELVSLQGLPLLAYRKFGLGAVVFAAVRLDSKTVGRWDGLGAMWEEIFTLREEPVEVQRTALDDKREEMLSNITGLPVPEPQFVAKLLLGYIGVVVVVFVLFRFRRKLEWGWCSLLLVAPLAAGVYHSIGRAARQEFKSTLNEISIVRIQGALADHEESSSGSLPRGWISSFHSLYSAEETTYNIRATTPDTVIAQGAVMNESGQAAVAPINVLAEDLIVADQMRVNEGGLQGFQSYSSRRFEGNVISRLQWGKQGLEGEIRNELGFPLQDAFILFNRHVVPLKNIGAGEVRSVSLTDPGNATYTPLRLVGGVALDVSRKKILENLFTPLGNYQPVHDEPVLVGWAEKPVSQVASESKPLEKKGLVLYMISLPCSRAEGEVLVPKGVCPVRISSALSYREGKWMQMQGFASGAEVELDFRIPPAVRDLAVENVRGYFEIENPGGDMKASVSAWDWAAGQWVALGKENSFTLPDPWRFVLKPIGRLRLKLSVTAIRGKAPTGEIPSLRAFKWRVQDVDVEIRGKLS